MSSLDWLQQWYAAQCDGEWEHHHGITFETLDNPGWLVKIDLTGTSLESEPMEEMATSDVRNGVEMNPNWIHCSVQEDQFIGAGGLDALPKVCEVFRKWVESAGA